MFKETSVVLSTETALLKVVNDLLTAFDDDKLSVPALL